MISQLINHDSQYAVRLILFEPSHPQFALLFSHDRDELDDEIEDNAIKPILSWSSITSQSKPPAGCGKSRKRRQFCFLVPRFYAQYTLVNKPLEGRHEIDFRCTIEYINAADLRSIVLQEYTNQLEVTSLNPVGGWYFLHRGRLSRRSWRLGAQSQESIASSDSIIAHPRCSPIPGSVRYLPFLEQRFSRRLPESQSSLVRQ